MADGAHVLSVNAHVDRRGERMRASGPVEGVVGQASDMLPLQHLFRPHPDQELTRRVVAVRAYELCERTLDLVPGLPLFGVAEPHH